MVRPDKWWEQRKSVSRALIYKKRYKTAYKITSEHKGEKWKKHTYQYKHH